MDLIRTTDHIQSRPGFYDHNTAPQDSGKPITNLSQFKGSAQPRGQANVCHAPDQYAPNMLQSADSPPPSLIARMTKSVIVTQRRRLASQPASSRDTRIAEQYKASYVLEDRGGATAPGAQLSLRPTGKAAGGMNPAQMTKQQIRTEQSELRGNIRQARQEYEFYSSQVENTTDRYERQLNINLAQASLNWKIACENRYDALMTEMEARSGGRGQL